MFGPDFMRDFFGFDPRRRRGRGFDQRWGFDPQRARVFERGDLKYVILDLLKDKPSHGYEIIRALEERFRGMYSPSAGAVYPTLQLLEDLGYLTSTQRDGKKIYSITDEGRRFLAEHRQSVDEIWDRVGGGWDHDAGEVFDELRHEFRNFARVVGPRLRAGRVDRHKWRRIRTVITRAMREIEDILEERQGTGETWT